MDKGCASWLHRDLHAEQKENDACLSHGSHVLAMAHGEGFPVWLDSHIVSHRVASKGGRVKGWLLVRTTKGAGRLCGAPSELRSGLPLFRVGSGCPTKTPSLHLPSLYGTHSWAENSRATQFSQRNKHKSC